METRDEMSSGEAGRSLLSAAEIRVRKSCSGLRGDCVSFSDRSGFADEKCQVLPGSAGSCPRHVSAWNFRGSTGKGGGMTVRERNISHRSGIIVLFSGAIHPQMPAAVRMESPDRIHGSGRSVFSGFPDRPVLQNFHCVRAVFCRPFSRLPQGVFPPSAESSKAEHSLPADGESAPAGCAGLCTDAPCQAG